MISSTPDGITAERWNWPRTTPSVMANLANLLAQVDGDMEAAIEHYHYALAADPKYARGARQPGCGAGPKWDGWTKRLPTAGRRLRSTLTAWQLTCI